MPGYTIQHPEPRRPAWAWVHYEYEDGPLVAIPTGWPPEDRLVGLISSTGVLPRLCRGEVPIERGDACPWPWKGRR